MKKNLIFLTALAACLAATVSLSFAAESPVPQIPVVNASEVKDEVNVEAADSVWVEDVPNKPVMEAFMLIPNKDLDILVPRMREEMLIYMEADSIYKCRNVYTGLSWIEEMTPNYLRVHLTDVSSLQLRVLPTVSKGKQPSDLVMSIYTVSADSETADSTVKFYRLTDFGNDSVTLDPIAAKKFLAVPNPEDFYDKEKAKAAGMKVKEMMDEMPFHTIAYDITQGQPTELTGHLTMDNYLTVEQRDRLTPYLRKTLHWLWDGKKFRLKKD